jgi:tetratricopeptide (TPR) repeat protein
VTYQEEGQARLKRLLSKQAITLAMEGRWREALEANRSLIESFPDDVESYNRLGRAYMELGEYSQAKEAYGRAIELDPYNTIAEKNLRRLVHLGKVKTGRGDVAGRVHPRDFIEEIGKAGVVNLSNLAPVATVAKMVAGDKVNLKVEGSSLVVENGRGGYLGQVEPKHALRLIKLMEGGNRYSAAIVSSAEKAVKVIIREVYQDPSQMGQLSFPPRGIEGDRAYTGDRMLRRGLEYEEGADEHSGFTIVGEDGEVLLEEFSEHEEKEESEE